MGVLTRVFPPEVVDEVIAEAGRTERRHRSLPARAMAYFAIGMALYSEGSYEDVLALLTDGLSWPSRAVEPVKLPTKSAIFQARDRLGVGAGEGAVRAGGAAVGDRRDAGVVAGRAAAGGGRRDAVSMSPTPPRTRSSSVGPG